MEIALDRHRAVYLCTRSVSRQARREGKMRKDTARVSQRFGASEDLWEYETPFVKHSQL